MLKKIMLCCLLLIPPLSGCTQSEAQQSQAQASQNSRLTNVEVQTVHPTVLEEYLTLTGHTESLRDVILASELGGTVKELHADRGERVSKGQVLAKVSADMYQAQLAEAEANLRLKQAALEKAKALYERGSISSMQRLQAQVEHDAAEANAKLAESRLERAIVRAPFDGVIDDRFADQGEMVPPGGQLFRLVDRRKMKIRSEMAELDVSTFHPGITAVVHIDAFPDTAFSATLVYVAASAHLASRTFPCEFELDNPNGLIRGGMMVRIRVLKDSHNNVLVLPQTALVETESGRNVFVLEGENVSKRNVTLGASNSGMVIVASGLNPEETVVVTGQRDLVDGQQVRVTSRKD